MIHSVFRQARLLALLTLAALGSLGIALAQEPKAQEPKATGEKQITNSIGMKLTLVPSGEFLMGSREPPKEEEAFFNKYSNMDWPFVHAFLENEHPQHRVRITKPFYLGTYHVTRGQFRTFVDDTGYRAFGDNFNPPDSGGNTWHDAHLKGYRQTDEHPVVSVTWDDAMAFCKWLSRKEGKTYRLPTEAEWEYACRAGTKTRYYSGDDPDTLAQVANVGDATLLKAFPTDPDWIYTIKTSDGYVFTAPVGQFKPNGFGLYDMHGNAWQWCADWYAKDYYDKSPVDDPKGPASGECRIVRGSYWGGRTYGVCSANREFRKPGDTNYCCGFRVARTP